MSHQWRTSKLLIHMFYDTFPHHYYMSSHVPPLEPSPPLEWIGNHFLATLGSVNVQGDRWKHPSESMFLSVVRTDECPSICSHFNRSGMVLSGEAQGRFFSLFEVRRCFLQQYLFITSNDNPQPAQRTSRGCSCVCVCVCAVIWMFFNGLRYVIWVLNVHCTSRAGLRGRLCFASVYCGQFWEGYF